MAEEKGKAVTEFSPLLYRNVLPYNTLSTFDGEMWRYVCRRQPVIMDCISSLTMFVQGLPWDIRARDANQSDELQESVDYHKDIFVNAQDGSGYLNYVDLLLQDFYMIPFGAGTETVRYKDGTLYSIRQIDGATLLPTYLKSTPVAQVAPGATVADPVYFTNKELVRMYQSPRPELMYRGWGMSPPEKVYLAIESLNRGDKYYATLLLDTPEAGLLDLGDMSEESARKWLEGFKNLFTGVDGFKIPVIYEHTTPVKYHPFTRAPNDLMFDNITMKYAQLVCAAFGLSTGDIGLKSSNGSLSSDIRDERHTKATGKAFVKAQLKEHFGRMLPKELEFIFIDVDDELLVSKGRARSANAVAGRNLIESGALTPAQWRAQLKADGLITIPLPETVNAEDFEILKEISGQADQMRLEEMKIGITQKQVEKEGIGSNTNLDRKGGQAGFSLQKRRNVRGGKLESIVGKDPVAATSGGMGETKRSDTDQIEKAVITKVNNRLLDLFNTAFQKVDDKVNEIRLRKIAKITIKKIFPIIRELTKIPDINKSEIVDEYLDIVFTKNISEENEIVQKSFNDLVEDIDYGKDKWWEVDIDSDRLNDILVTIWLSGLEKSAKNIQEYLYEEDVEYSPDVQATFSVSDENRDRYKERAEEILKLVNQGSLFFLKRIAISLVSKMLSEKDEDDVENILTDDFFINSVIQALYQEYTNINDERVRNIVTYEGTRVENEGIQKQYSSIGVDKKRWRHPSVGHSECVNCLENVKLGFVDMDYQFDTKFGPREIPPCHPTCDCDIEFDNKQLKSLDINYYTG